MASNDVSLELRLTVLEVVLVSIVIVLVIVAASLHVHGQGKKPSLKESECNSVPTKTDGFITYPITAG